MPYVRIRSEVNLPDLPRGTVAHLVPDARIKGLLARGLVTDLDAEELTVPSGTVRYLLEWVGDDPARIRAALAAELARPRPRRSLIDSLEPREAVYGGEVDREGDDTGGGVAPATGDLVEPGADREPAG